MKKIIAIEFTLTCAGLIKRGWLSEADLKPDQPSELRCRVLIDDGFTKGPEVFWRAENALGEAEWCGGPVHHNSHPEYPAIGGYALSKLSLAAHAFRFMTEAIDPQLQAEARKLANGATVFDLGTM